MSTNNFPRVSAILSRIPDAATRWPGWFWPHCPECGEECDLDAYDDPFCYRDGCANYCIPITPVQKFAPITDESDADAWHGGDTDPRNMHHLWAMLEAVDVWDEPCISKYKTSNACIETEKGPAFGEADNIIEAMLRCLEEATQ